jgi:hypothetical protein
VIFKDLQYAIEKMERLRHWKFLDTMPTHKRIKKPCCTQIASAKAGQPLKLVFEPSIMQGDTDDAHNSGLAQDNGHRLHIDNKIDWVAICHFWAPAITINREQIAEESLREADGFVSPELLPKQLRAVNKRYRNV